MKILPMGAKLFHAEVWMDGQKDRQTDRYGEPNCRFRSFAKAYKNNFYKFLWLLRTFHQHLMTYQSTHVHGASLSSKDDESSTSQEISHILWSPKINYVNSTYKSLSLLTILTH